MAYQSLYRRYRPGRFSDVRGQEHVVRALRNAVRDDRIGHAYLFSGPRGTGKTSTARILAKALNCENLQDGEPDGTCDSCLAIDAGTSYDVQELDAASNNSVDDISELIGRVNLGSPGRTKVYILDEVHMLSKAAANKLLKTLEEPPGHVVFVLATTDPQKVLPTIRSRTQHYDFHLLPADELSEHIAWVIHDAELDLAPEVIEHVVRAGGGSARDTLSALDQVAAAGGVIDKAESLDDLFDAIAASDPSAALAAVAEAVAAGRDPRVLGESLLERLRDVFLVRMGASIAHVPPGEVDRIKAWADQMGTRATTRAMELVGDALLAMRQAPDPRIPLEVALVKITASPSGEADTSALEARVAALESELAALKSGAPAVAAPIPAASASPPPSESQAPAGSPAPTRPAPPAPPKRGRPADAARAALANKRGGGDDPVGRPVEAAAAADPPEPVEASEPSPAHETGTAQVRADGPPAGSMPAATPKETGDSAGAQTLTLDLVTDRWQNQVMAGLGGLTKAMFSAATVEAVDENQVVLGMPNDVHRQKCERKRDEVETALAEALGSGVSLRFEISGGSGQPGVPTSTSPPSGSTGVPVAESDDDYEIETTNVRDLPDADEPSTGGIDALTDAFPGAELVEGQDQQR